MRSTLSFRNGAVDESLNVLGILACIAWISVDDEEFDKGGIPARPSSATSLP